jgi:hypothetical protein
MEVKAAAVLFLTHPFVPVDEVLFRHDELMRAIISQLSHGIAQRNLIRALYIPILNHIATMPNAMQKFPEARSNILQIVMPQLLQDLTQESEEGVSPASFWYLADIA